MSYHLFLDDKREVADVTWLTLPNTHWEIVRDNYEFTNIIAEKGVPTFISYDCDLCDEHYKAYFEFRENYILRYHEFRTKCGIHCLEYLLQVCKRVGTQHPEYALHTQNHYVTAFMHSLINKFNNGSKILKAYG